MAEAALFSFATTLLSTIASSALVMAYEKGRSIWEARDELAKLRNTIQAIQSVLLDAEKKQEGSAAVKLWTERVRAMLYEVDDLFDEVTTNDQVKRRMEGNELPKKVRSFGSHLNPIVSSGTIAKKVKGIRKKLDQISKDMAPLSFVQCHSEEPVYGMRRGQNEGHFVDPKVVFGRDDEKKAILKFLLDESIVEETISVIAVVGIGGMGKTTVAQLVYNDDGVEKKFENKWWACISDMLDEREVIGKIYQSITGGSYRDLNMSCLQSEIRQFVRSRKFLLVLDDLWDEDRNRGLKLRSLLGGGAKGSKIVVTTRSSSVASAMDAAHTHALEGLREEMSWCLFKSVAFQRGQEEDPQRVRIGREILKKCSNVPLAITAIASVLYTRNSITEWELLKDNEISQIGQGENGIMSALKLSYNHLPPYLKNCFAYCSVFPKDHIIKKDYLIQLWIAQGYVHLESSNGSQTLDDVGHMYFMELFRRSFFQEAVEGSKGEILECKMHDLVHDLAELVAGKETAQLTSRTVKFNGCIRHLGIQDGTDDSQMGLLSMPEVKQLRSLLKFTRRLDFPSLHQRITEFRSLRALDLSNQCMEEVPSSVGELLHLRYLNLSANKFRYLPDSITKLFNLLTLDIRQCWRLEALPRDFRKLINLRHLRVGEYCGLKYMPPGFEELTCLQCLDCFIVGEGSSLDALAQLKLRGVLEIWFSNGVVVRDEDALTLAVSKLPETLEGLELNYYPGKRIQSLPTNLVKLKLLGCRKVKHLPTSRLFRHLKKIELVDMDEMEYVEEEEAAGSNVCRLKAVRLKKMPKLKGWSGKQVATREHSRSSLFTFPTYLCFVEGMIVERCQQIEKFSAESLTSLQNLEIKDCSELKELRIGNCPEPESFLRVLKVSKCSNLRNLYLPSLSSSVLEELEIGDCSELNMRADDEASVDWLSLRNLQNLKLYKFPALESFTGESLTSLRVLHISECTKLKKLSLSSENGGVLEELKIVGCPGLDLWGEDNRGIDWASFSSLYKLILDERPERFPDCLQQRKVDEVDEFGYFSSTFTRR